MKFRKLRIFICFVLCFCLSGSSFAFADEKKATIETSIYDLVLDQALRVDSEYSVKDKNDFAVVENKLTVADVSSATVRGIPSDKESKFVIRSVKEHDNRIEVTTIIPYHIQEDGSLIDSFDYAKQLFGGGSVGHTVTPTRDMVDISVTYTVFYDQCAYNYLTPIYYRHGSLQAYWSSSKPLTNVTLFVWYKSCGELHEYPKCLDYENPADSYISGNPDYVTSTLISKPNAVEGTKYYSAVGQMPTNRVLYFSKAFDLGHGGWVDIRVMYKLNGKIVNADRTDVIYSK